MSPSLAKALVQYPELKAQMQTKLADANIGGFDSAALMIRSGHLKILNAKAEILSSFMPLATSMGIERERFI